MIISLIMPMLHIQIGDPADGVTTALWDLTRYEGKGYDSLLPLNIIILDIYIPAEHTFLHTTGVLKMVRTNIYRCEGRPLEVEGQRFVSVSLHGSSFLYNQIR